MYHHLSCAQDVLEDAGDPTKKAEIAAVVLQEGLASICLVKSSLTKVCAKIERTMPKKKEVFRIIGSSDCMLICFSVRRVTNLIQLR